MIEAVSEAQHIARAESAKRLGLAQNVATKRMAREEKTLELIENHFRGLVLIALYLVDNHLHLAVHLLLRVGASQSYIEQKVDGS